MKNDRPIIMEGPTKEKDMRVLVAYEDLAAGKRAMAVLKRVGSQCGGGGRMTHVMLRFDLMSDATFFELAVNEALAAEIVVIAAGEGKELPQKVRDWLVRWLLMKGDRPRALVATLDYHLTEAGQPAYVRPYLARLAGLGRLQFFANGGGQGAEADFAGIKGSTWAWDFVLQQRKSPERN